MVLAYCYIPYLNIIIGASTTLYAAVAPEVQQDSFRGVYLADCNIKTPTCECARDVDGTLSQLLYNAVEKDIQSVVSTWK